MTAPSANVTEPIGAAAVHLATVDTILAELIAQHGPCPLGTVRREPFDALVTAIVGQQLSTRAAASIRERLSVHLGLPRPFAPGHFFGHSAESLRGTGLSAAKARAVVHLAEAAAQGRIDLDVLADQDDEAVIGRLVALPGIGRWTAEMFLIFSLGRPDVLSLADAGLWRAVRTLYGISARDDIAFRALAEPWRPYRSMASWYLWRHLDSP